MEKIKEIKKVEGSSPKGSWVRNDIYFESGKKYGVFDEKIIKGFEAGDNVEIELKDNGNFKNLVKMVKVLDDNKKTSQNGSKGSYHLTIESVRAESLKSACNYVSSQDLKATPYELIKFAKIFQKYIENGSD